MTSAFTDHPSAQRSLKSGCSGSLRGFIVDSAQCEATICSFASSLADCRFDAPPAAGNHQDGFSKDVSIHARHSLFGVTRDLRSRVEPLRASGWSRPFEAASPRCEAAASRCEVERLATESVARPPASSLKSAPTAWSPNRHVEVGRAESASDRSRQWRLSPVVGGDDVQRAVQLLSHAVGGARQHRCRRQRRVKTAPPDVARVLCTLHANDVGVCIRRIVAALLRSCDQHRLRRLEPQPDERHRCGSRHLLDGLPVCMPSHTRHRRWRCDLLGRSERRALPTWRRHAPTSATNILPDQGAPGAGRRTDASESRRCGRRPRQARRRRKARDRAPASTCLSPRDLRPRRVMDGADAGVARPSRDTRGPGREAHSGARTSF